MFYLIDSIRKNKKQSIFEMINLLTIELKMINLIMFDLMTNNSMSINLMTIKLIMLIEQLIEMLIESLIVVEKITVKRFVIELIEKYLIELIRMHVDIFKINSIMIKMLINVEERQNR